MKEGDATRSLLTIVVTPAIKIGRTSTLPNVTYERTISISVAITIISRMDCRAAVSVSWVGVPAAIFKSWIASIAPTTAAATKRPAINR